MAGKKKPAGASDGGDVIGFYPNVPARVKCLCVYAKNPANRAESP